MEAVWRSWSGDTCYYIIVVCQREGPGIQQSMCCDFGLLRNVGNIASKGMQCEVILTRTEEQLGLQLLLAFAELLLHVAFGASSDLFIHAVDLALAC